MKKSYEAPSIELVKFEYKDQVVAASTSCMGGRKGFLEYGCTSGGYQALAN